MEMKTMTLEEMNEVNGGAVGPLVEYLIKNLLFYYGMKTVEDLIANFKDLEIPDGVGSNAIIGAGEDGSMPQT